MKRFAQGFSLIELVAVIVVLGIMAISVTAKLRSGASGQVQSSRDDVIAALFFAQQAAMSRSNIQVVVSSNQINVTESGTAVKVTSSYYPLSFAPTVSATPITLTYDKLGRINTGSTKQTIVLTGSGGASATVTVEASGYAH